MKRNGNKYVDFMSHFRQVVLEIKIIKNCCYNGV